MISTLREEITALDRRLVETINARIEIVARLRAYKAQNDIPFVDPDRERALLDELKSANHGPLSDEGLHELVTFVLALVKQELAHE